MDGVLPANRVGHHETTPHGIDPGLHMGGVEELVEEQIQGGQSSYRFRGELGEGAGDG